MFGQSPFSTTAFSEELSSGTPSDARIYVTGFGATLEQGAVDFSLDGKHAVTGVDAVLEFGQISYRLDTKFPVINSAVQSLFGNETIELITPVNVTGDGATLEFGTLDYFSENFLPVANGAVYALLGNETIELITPVKVTGNQATLQFGVPDFRGDANIAVTGLTATLSTAYSLRLENNLSVTTVGQLELGLGDETIELITPVKVIGNQATLTTAYSYTSENFLSVTNGAIQAQIGNEVIELITPVQVTGNHATLQFGVPEFRGDANIAVTGISATLLFGDAVPATGNFLQVTTLGQLTLGLGDETIELITPVNVTGNEATLEFGDYTAQTNSYLDVISDPLVLGLGAYEVELRQDVPAPGAQLDLTLNGVRIVSGSSALVTNDELTLTLGEVVIPQTALVSVATLGTVQAQLGVYGVESITPVNVNGLQATTQFGTLGYFSENFIPVANEAIEAELGAYRTEMITPVVVTSLGALSLEIGPVSVAQGTGAPVSGLEIDVQMGQALIYENAEIFADGFEATLEFGDPTVSISAPVSVDSVGRIRTFLGAFDTYTETNVYLTSLGEIRMDIEPVTVQTQAIIHVDTTGALQLHMGRELVWHQIAAPKKTRWRDVGIS